MRFRNCAAVQPTVQHLIDRGYHEDDAAEEVRASIGWHVYVITDDTNKFKIGMSKDADSRVRDLQISNPLKLRVVAVATCQNKGDALKLERGILTSCRRHRLWGEWVRAKNEKALLKMIMLGWGQFILAREAEIAERFRRLGEPQPAMHPARITEIWREF